MQENSTSRRDGLSTFSRVPDVGLAVNRFQVTRGSAAPGDLGSRTAHWYLSVPSLAWAGRSAEESLVRDIYAIGRGERNAGERWQ